MKILSIHEINERLRADAAGFCQEVDAAYDRKIRAIAEEIRDNAMERPFILLSGPSGSGKTTSALKLEAYLDSWGCETHTLSMDNYFSPFTPEQWELVNQGKIDLEAPDRMDIPFLNEQLEEILAGRPVELPKYNFANSTREKLGVTLERKPGELVLLEGIHALNPAVITLPEDRTNRIYVSVRTRIDVDGKLLHPAWLRLMRRLLRDKRGRARSYAETMSMFDNVELGETRYIMRYKHRATHDVDTFHAYELSAYRALAEDSMDELRAIERLDDLVSALAQAEPLPMELVPSHSLIRGFLGDSQYTD